MLNQSEGLNRAGATFNEKNWPSRPGSLLQNHGWLNQQVVCGCPACMTLSDRRLAALAAKGTIAPLNTFDSGAPLALDQTFKLHSNPTASHTIYLDFDGHLTEGTSWNSYFNNPSIVSPAYDIDGNAASFSSAELERIQRIWMRVAEDFAPFNVNVTTEAPVLGDLIKTDSNDSRWGVRVVVTKDTENSGAGGIAYINSFNWNSDTPVWVFNSSEIGVSAAASHEVGHALGLSHDGAGSTTYYNGHGSGETGWGPIMGSGYYQNVTTWDDGTYYNSNNGGSAANYNKGADDLAVITSGNGFSYRVDDHGNSFNTASALNLGAVNGAAVEVSQFGVIERRTDVDYFSFSTGEGFVNLNFNSYFSEIHIADGNGGYETRYLPAPFDGAGSSNDQGSNLDIQARLFDDNQTLIGEISNPLGLSAGFTNLFLTAGDYFIEIDGVGFGNPTSSSPTGYSDYGSLGQYYITGSILQPLAQAGVLVTPTAGLTTSEAGNSASFTVVLASAPTAEVVINLSSSNPQEGVADQSQLVFTAANWNVAQTVTVTGVNDEVIDGDQPYSVLLAPALSSDSNYNGLDAEDVQLVNLDNDVPVVTVAFSTGNQTLVEGLAASAFYTVSLSAASNQTINVDYTTSNGSALAGSDYVALAGTLTFAPGVTTQSVTVSLLNDSLNEADETFTLNLL
ncbi:MAG: Calx-beta domain-containing protein, partial [Cyanobacteriota bacterium]